MIPQLRSSIFICHFHCRNQKRKKMRILLKRNVFHKFSIQFYQTMQYTCTINQTIVKLIPQLQTHHPTYSKFVHKQTQIQIHQSIVMCHAILGPSKYHYRQVNNILLSIANAVLFPFLTHNYLFELLLFFFILCLSPIVSFVHLFVQLPSYVYMYTCLWTFVTWLWLFIDVHRLNSI